MEKFDFSPNGLSAMCQHFYAMTDERLLSEADLLGANLPNWFSKHFDLSESQQVYLASIHPRVMHFMAVNCSFAFANRLPIVLEKPFAKSGEPEPEPSDSKVTKPKSKLAASILPNAGYKAEGEMVITITY